ncbi:BZ3500_MvSof-1268-A1-R1_Chr3-3g06611 [Microbotryum saponariae]|uniref:BZ3500_MvSof-1268-A1-R1_Chr3-3g06611 protein n=1 Tax=Microbotryum saponariae TaxID=289078 RepID=A0A2X0L049_9BASI|nr:BZ3500_MvSof-1268-A1-R1_Chr3-3g06611 [Microbotryum saponariae]SDA04578.1 BZ3501_MvSof-1269-A2-R1_Chr3-2g06298 [Microbotryum saponariae]
MRATSANTRDAHKSDLSLTCWPSSSVLAGAAQAYGEGGSAGDRRVESIKVLEDHAITSALTTLVQAILEKASTSNRILVVCGGASNAIIRTSRVQVASKNDCVDAVGLFPHANTPEMVEAWKMGDATRQSWEAQHKRRIHDDRLMDDVYIVKRQGAQGE